MANLERLGGGFAFFCPQNRNQTIKTAKKIKQSIPLCYPTIPSHSENKSKQSKSRDNPGKYSTLPPCPLSWSKQTAILVSQTFGRQEARSGHLWRSPAERRGPAALRQWLLCQLLTQARLRQPSACPWNPVLTQRDRAPFRRSPARDLIFTRGRQRRDHGVSSKFPVCHRRCNYPQLPT